MKLYLDSANIDEISQACQLGVISGVTTNPSLLAKAGGDVRKSLQQILEIVDGPVSVECVSENRQEMVAEARRLVKLAPPGKDNVVVKIPLIPEGLAAVKQLAEEGIKTNVTLVFSANQAILAACAGATYVSPFVGRLDDIGHVGMDLVTEISEIYDVHGISTSIIAASIRHPEHVTAAARAGADIVTIPWSVLMSMYKHPLTVLGIQRFMADWQKLTGSTKPLL